MIDIVKDQPYGADYLKEEDPKLYVSEKSGRGPLEDTWLEDYWADVEVYIPLIFFYIFSFFFCLSFSLEEFYTSPLK